MKHPLIAVFWSVLLASSFAGAQSGGGGGGGEKPGASFLQSTSYERVLVGGRLEWRCRDGARMYDPAAERHRSAWLECRAGRWGRADDPPYVSMPTRRACQEGETFTDIMSSKVRFFVCRDGRFVPRGPVN